MGWEYIHSHMVSPETIHLAKTNGFKVTHEYIAGEEIFKLMDPINLSQFKAKFGGNLPPCLVDALL